MLERLNCYLAITDDRGNSVYAFSWPFDISADIAADIKKVLNDVTERCLETIARDLTNAQ